MSRNAPWRTVVEKTTETDSTLQLLGRCVVRIGARGRRGRGRDSRRDTVMSRSARWPSFRPGSPRSPATRRRGRLRGGRLGENRVGRPPSATEADQWPKARQKRRPDSPHPVERLERSEDTTSVTVGDDAARQRRPDTRQTLYIRGGRTVEIQRFSLEKRRVGRRGGAPRAAPGRNPAAAGLSQRIDAADLRLELARGRRRTHVARFLVPPPLDMTYRAPQHDDAGEKDKRLTLGRSGDGVEGGRQ